MAKRRKAPKLRASLLSAITTTARRASSYRLAGMIPQALRLETTVDRKVAAAEARGWGMGAGSAEMRGQESAKPYRRRKRKR